MQNLKNGMYLLHQQSHITNYNPLRFLYTLFLAIDANFKLKQKDRGIKDVEIAPGWGCYVESSRYERHVLANIDQPEVI